MKKLFFILAGIIVILCIANFTLSQCEGSKDEVEVVDTTNIDSVISVENFLNKDFAVMDTIAPKYVWYETNIKLTGEVDTLESVSLEMVSNVFQTTTQVGQSFVTNVYCGKHADGNDWFDVKENAFWVEDNDLTPYKDSLITFEQAFDALMKANCPKPKSVFCTLRKQVGPIDANPQYIFGNDNRGLAYVDAITGAVSTINPVFGEPDALKAFSPDSVFNK